MNQSSCKFCNHTLAEPFLSLGKQPLCNSYILPEKYQKQEKSYPLDVFFCPSCYLVQLTHSIPPSVIFEDYAYLSSYSDTWVSHAKEYSRKVIDRFNLDNNSFVVEIASNDGYLLKNFIEFEIPSLGIEPANNPAEAAKAIGVPTMEEYFNYDLSNRLIMDYKKADLIITNNVYAHVPDINDFTDGIKNLLSDSGVWTIEFPYLKNLLELNQFDTIYHEHYFYFSLHAVNNILEHHGLKIFDIEMITTHGGSIRLYATHAKNHKLRINGTLSELLEEEKELGLTDKSIYKDFQSRINTIKNDLLGFLENAKAENKKIIGYGAAGKANTLLNYCGINSELLSFIVDRNPLKQNTFMPGSRIPVYDTDKLKDVKPDYVLILPWNIKKEIMEANKIITEWGGKFIVPIPDVHIDENSS